MKKAIFLSFLFFIFGGLFLSKGYCNEPIDKVVKQSELIYNGQSFNLEEVIENSDLKPKETIVKYKNDLGRDELKDIQSEDELSYGEPYKVFIMDSNIINNLASGNDISQNIKDSRYLWEVPIINKDGQVVASFIIDYFDGKLQVADVGGTLSTENTALSSKPQDISKLLKTKNIHSADSVYHLRFPNLKMDTIYINTGTDEFFTPLVENMNYLGIINKKIYDKNEMSNIIKNEIEKSEQYLKEYNETEEADGTLSGGIETENNSSFSIIFILALGTIVIVALKIKSAKN